MPFRRDPPNSAFRKFTSPDCSSFSGWRWPGLLRILEQHRLFSGPGLPSETIDDKAKPLASKATAAILPASYANERG
jgi:hypothetical protein